MSRLRFDAAPPVSPVRRDPKSAADFLGKIGSRVTAGDRSETAGALAEASSVRERVSELSWYQTIELPWGVVTEGMFDHRPLVPRYGLPDRLEGARCLDIACADGFWAFELERRGGDVTAVDVPDYTHWDWPPGADVPEDAQDGSSAAGATFELARSALDSRVERIMCNIYELDPARLGTFDFVHASDVLLHLERPWEALRRFRSVVAEGGEALIADAVDLECDGMQVRYNGGFDLVWFLPSVDALAQMATDAGFGSVEVLTMYNLPAWDLEDGMWRAVLRLTP